MKKAVVFDAYAIISYLKDEVGAKTVGRTLKDVVGGKLHGSINAVNLAEVYYITRRIGGEGYADQVVNSLHEWGLEIIPADHQLALKAGEIKAVAPLSLADAFAAVTAQLQEATLLTGDPDFHVLEGKIKIQWLE